MNTLVIGASGKIGQILIPRMLAASIPVKAMVRDENAARLLLPEATELFTADLESDFSRAFEGCDRVIFTAGSGGSTGADKTLLIDLWGAAKAIDQAEIYQIKHFVMVSARGATNPDNGPETIKPYSVAKHFADRHLMASHLDYTILRPGRLTDEPGTGKITTSRPAEKADQIIPREDVADVIIHTLSTPSSHGRIVELYQGNKPIAELFS